MWVLVQNEFKMLRSSLLQIYGIVIASVVVFSRFAPQLVSSYFIVFPVVMGVTLPQMSFTLEERAKTFILLRSLPVRPRDIVAAKYLVAYLVTALFWVMTLITRAALPTLGFTYGMAAYVLLISAVLSGISYYQHFALGVKSAKTALLVTFFVIGAPVAALSQNPAVQAWLSSPAVQQLTFWADTIAGNLATLLLGAVAMLISYWFSASLFTRRDVSRLP